MATMLASSGVLILLAAMYAYAIWCAAGCVCAITADRLIVFLSSLIPDPVEEVGEPEPEKPKVVTRLPQMKRRPLPKEEEDAGDLLLARNGYAK